MGRLFLTYKPPYDWNDLLGFLETHVVPEAEVVADGGYARTVSLGGVDGWVDVRHEARHGRLAVTFAPVLTPVLPNLERRLRQLFDLDVDPQAVASHLGRDARFLRSLARRPGLRVPGSFDAFDLAVRAILGQQVSVRAATVIAGKFAAAFGAEIKTPVAGLSRLPPSPIRVATLDWEDIARIGVIGTRARSIIALAQGIVDGRVTLDAGAEPRDVSAQLLAIKGIGPWTAHYIAMRALSNPDSFPKEDIALRRMLGGATAKEAEDMSQAWRPWRSYATMHLWAEYMEKGA